MMLASSNAFGALQRHLCPDQTGGQDGQRDADEDDGLHRHGAFRGRNGQGQLGRLPAVGTFRGRAHSLGRELDVFAALLTGALQVFRHGRFLARLLPFLRNLGLVSAVVYNIVKSMNTDEKFKQEHSARLEDFFLTRRQFLRRTGVGFGALSLAALLGENFFGSTAGAGEAASLAPRSEGAIATGRRSAGCNGSFARRRATLPDWR